MRFELRPEYRDRKALYVDAEALALLRRTCLAPSTEAQEAGLEKVLPEEVMAELKRPLYHGPAFAGMTVRLDQ